MWPRLLSLAFLAQMAISHRLWLGRADERVFPLVPPLAGVPDWLTAFGPYCLVAGLLLVLAYPTHRTVLRLVPVGIVLSALGDIHRLQVWVYFYGLIVLFWAFRPEKTTPETPNATWLLMLAGLYGWAGINKVNIWYATNEFPWLLEPLGPTAQMLSRFQPLAYATALVECAAGVALLFAPTRKAGLAVLLAMHIGILILISPWVHGWNPVVVPWNLFLTLLLGYLFFSEKKSPTPSLALRDIWPVSAQNGVIWAGFWLLPCAGYLGWFEKPLSFNLYTGMQSEATMSWRNLHGQGQRKSGIFQKAYPRGKDLRLQLNDWILPELNVPPYSSPWALRKTADRICDTYFRADTTAGYFILTVGRWDKIHVDNTYCPCHGTPATGK